MRGARTGRAAAAATSNQAQIDEGLAAFKREALAVAKAPLPGGGGREPERRGSRPSPRAHRVQDRRSQSARSIREAAGGRAVRHGVPARPQLQARGRLRAATLSPGGGRAGAGWPARPPREVPDPDRALVRVAQYARARQVDRPGGRDQQPWRSTPTPTRAYVIVDVARLAAPLDLGFTPVVDEALTGRHDAAARAAPGQVEGIPGFPAIARSRRPSRPRRPWCRPSRPRHLGGRGRLVGRRRRRGLPRATT